MENGIVPETMMPIEVKLVVANLLVRQPIVPHHQMGVEEIVHVVNVDLIVFIQTGVLVEIILIIILARLGCQVVLSVKCAMLSVGRIKIVADNVEMMITEVLDLFL